MSKELQPRDPEKQTFGRTSGIRSLEEGLLNPDETAKLSELRKLARNQSFRDDVIETLLARQILLDLYMFREFYARYVRVLEDQDADVDLDGLFGKLQASAGHISRLVSRIEERIERGAISLEDLVEGEIKESDE